MKKRFLALIIMSFCMVALLVGCSASNPTQENQAQNRQYMSSVNQIMEQFDAQMADFASAVKDGEILSLTSQLSAVTTAVDSLKALDVPDDMKDIQDAYVNGVEELQTALQQYVQLYQEVELPPNGSFDFSTYADRLAEIQQHYSNGVASLQDADQKATDA